MVSLFANKVQFSAPVNSEVSDPGKNNVTDIGPMVVFAILEGLIALRRREQPSGAAGLIEA